MRTVRLGQDNNGNFKARKRLPNDVREDYGHLYGPIVEAKFSAPASTKLHVAKQLFNEWLAEVEGRIEAIRAQRKGVDISLTRQQTRALAGEWYDWFIARHPTSDLQKWEDLRDKVHETLVEAAGDDVWNQNDPDDLWRDDEELRKEVRPVLADVGETAQFLAMKRLVLDGDTRNRFLDYLYDDLAAAFQRLIKIAQGDYTPDEYRKRFPKFESPDNGETPKQLFETWVLERKPAPGTVDNWRYFFAVMTEHFKDRSAASITADEAQQWITSLISPPRSAGTVANNWLNASNTVFGWAEAHKRIRVNPFADVMVTVPKKIKLRDTPAFHLEEQRMILKAALDIADTSKPDEAAKRWVPWLSAYTGARVGELTQLRKNDVIEREGIHALRITPEAGAVKGGKARVVPLHEHLIAQGFLKFVADHYDGPLFYKPASNNDAGDPANPKKPRFAQSRQRLASWVRSLGITDNELQPNHAWRHTFKQIADHAGISERMSNYITGHAQKNEGAKYGAPTLEQMAKAMEKFPRYVL